MALSMCVIEEPAPKTDVPVVPDVQKKIAKVDPKEFYKELDKAPRKEVLDNARKALQKNGTPNAAQVLAHPHRARRRLDALLPSLPAMNGFLTSTMSK